MPLLAYFLVTGSVLLALLFVAEAQLGPPPSLSMSTNFYGLPVPYKAASTTRVLTVRDAPEPNIATMALAQSTTAAEQPPSKSTKATHERKSKKPQKTARRDASRNMFAQSGVTPRQGPGIVW